MKKSWYLGGALIGVLLLGVIITVAISTMSQKTSQSNLPVEPLVKNELQEGQSSVPVSQKSDLITIEAVYQYDKYGAFAGEELEDEVCFHSMSSSQMKFDPDQSFCIADETVKKLFGPRKDEGNTGNATIVVKDYKKNARQESSGAKTDIATFVELIKKD